MFRSLTAAFRAAIGLAVAFLLTAAAVPLGASAATPGITFDLGMYGACIGGTAAPSANIDVIWRDSNGAVKLHGNTTSLNYGLWSACVDDPSTGVMPGDKIKVSDGSSTRSYVVPNFTMRIDRVNEQYTGTGPAGRTIKLGIPNGDTEHSYGVRVAQDGTWTYKPTYGLGGSFYEVFADANWTSPNSDRLELWASLPQIGVTLGKPDFAGVATPFATVTPSILGHGDVSGTAVADRDGNFTGTFTNSAGHVVSVSPGDRISAPSVASDADWIVPTITGSADKATEHVTGTCSDTGTAGGYVGIWVIRPGGHLRAYGRWNTDADGSFDADFTDFGIFERQRADIKTGDRIKIDCYQTSGDWARLTFAVR